MKMKQNRNILEELLVISSRKLGEESIPIDEKARVLYEQYCRNEAGKSKEITMHTVKKIFPCIAFYKAVIQYTGQKETAYAMLHEYFASENDTMAKKLKRLLKIPFLYKLVPGIMKKVIHKMFGEKSGFQMIDYNTKGNSCHIDMIQCPYYSNCLEQGCPELTTIFCDGDDAIYGNMHSKLSWERKKTIGRGNDCCDFILRVGQVKSSFKQGGTKDATDE